MNHKFLRVSNSIKIVSLFMTVLMVWFHSLPFFASSISYEFSDFISNFAAVAMCYFFQTSSFLLYLNLSQANVSIKLMRRVKNLLVPYLLWNTIALLCFGRESLLSTKSIIKGYTLAPFDGPTWYILIIFILSLLAPVVVWIYQKNRKLFLSLAILAIFVFFVLAASKGVWGTDDSVVVYITSRIHFVPSYILGMIMGLFYDELSSFIGNRTIVIPLVFLVIMMWGGDWFSDYFVLFIPTMLVCYFSTTEVLHNSKLVDFFSHCSFLVYCTHGLVHSIGFKYIEDTSSVESVLFGVFCPFIVFAVVGILKLLSYRFPIVNRVTDFLSGGRL